MQSGGGIYFVVDTDFNSTQNTTKAPGSTPVSYRDSLILFWN